MNSLESFIATIQDLTDKNILITGGTSGIGLETAKVLASKNANIIIIGRNTQKGESAIKILRTINSNIKLEYFQVDLMSLSEIKQFAKQINDTLSHLDVLFNNAGIMMPDHYIQSKDGFEAQLATNYIAPVSLTMSLLDLLSSTPNSRVITMTTVPIGINRIDANVLKKSYAYHPWRAYTHSKLLSAMFARSLQDYCNIKQLKILSLGVQPGLTKTNMPKRKNGGNTLMMNFFRLSFIIMPWLEQKTKIGALSPLYTIVEPNLNPGSVYGPIGLLELSGKPGLSKINQNAQVTNHQLRRQLWNQTMELIEFNRGKIMEK